MSRKWIHSVVFVFSIIVLAGCNQTVEEQALAGMNNAETTFSNEPSETNKSIGHIELYIPKGYGIEKGINESNYTIINGSDSYILFVNPNETEDSQLHYNILKDDPKSKILQDKTFKTDGVFGFSAVVELEDEQYELVVSVGGIKLTTISADKKIDDKLQIMMQIVQSVQMIKEQK
ncbi:MAG: hypothetical protein ABS944_13230 [Solibacillus sp.]|jgi:hypothetical protein|uniref:hypothetical protein n=1 Tax=unclassified Solibacillus TaxID=2637870 RepID=UPI0030FCBE9A